MLKVEKILEEIDSDEKFEEFISELQSRLSIRCNKSDDGLMILNYDQIDTPKYTIGVNIAGFDTVDSNEFRGLVIDSKERKVVSFPFVRFYNQGEGYASKIDWTSARIEEKVDGSLVQLFKHNGEWRITTRGSVDAKGSLPFSNSKYETFADLIWSLIPKSSLKYLNDDLIYIFEVVSPYNRVVTRYEEPALYVLTVRDRSRDFQEITNELLEVYAKHFDAKVPVSERVFSLEDVIFKANDSDVTFEGYVVVDRDNNRIKVKNKSYLELYKLFNNGSPNFYVLIAKGEESEFLSYYPEYKEDLEQVKNKLASLLLEADLLYQLAYQEESQKEFALKVKDSPLASLIFDARKNDYSNIRESWKALDLNRKVSLMKKVIG